MKLHLNSQTHFKKSKYHALTKREKLSLSLAWKRIVIEHMFHKLKVFRICARDIKRFALRFNLVVAITILLEFNSF